MGSSPFPYRKTFILGFGFFGISIVWPVFNSFIPPMLEKLGLAKTSGGQALPMCSSAAALRWNTRAST
ncbi:MAG: hypothetical protein HY870_24425, partial [Chloroflexi bacterium]|nr:hypothetical protein [Chloroflexota bacterium]